MKNVYRTFVVFYPPVYSIMSAGTSRVVDGTEMALVHWNAQEKELLRLVPTASFKLHYLQDIRKKIG
jgi:hypothetical protein